MKWVGRASASDTTARRRGGGLGRNQYFSGAATQATANDSKHHEKILEQGDGGRNEKDKKRTVK